MVRKRNRYPGRVTKRTRPRTPAPKVGWVISDLAKLTGMPVRRIRYYVEHGLIRPLEFRGTATRYQRHELLRLLAVPLVRTAATRTLAALKRALDVLGDAELERLVVSHPLPPDVSAALGVAAVEPGDQASASGSPLAELPALGAAGQPVSDRSATELWYRVELLPGLELMLRANASPAVRSAAQRIRQEYVG